MRSQFATGRHSRPLSYTPKTWHLFSFRGSEGLPLLERLVFLYYLYATYILHICQGYTTRFLVRGGKLVRLSYTYAFVSYQERKSLKEKSMTALTLNLDAIVQITDDAFYALCRTNPDLKFERTRQGELIVMPPTGGETGKRNGDIFGAVWVWNKQHQLGIAFDSSTGFKLPNGANRSPDVAWMLLARWEALTIEQRRRFPPIAPDFVVELRSDTDSLLVTIAKMQEYIDNGVRLGWLIDPKTKQVEIYRQGQNKEVLSSPTNLSGEEVLPGFVLDLKEIL